MAVQVHRSAWQRQAAAGGTTKTMQTAAQSALATFAAVTIQPRKVWKLR